MMDDFTRVNTPRVEKMLAMLDTIEKSARSNGVDPAGLLAPLTVRLKPMALTMPPGVTPTQQGAVVRRDIALWQEAQTAPLHELMSAYATISARLGDLVTDTKDMGL